MFHVKHSVATSSTQQYIPTIMPCNSGFFEAASRALASTLKSKRSARTRERTGARTRERAHESIRTHAHESALARTPCSLCSSRRRSAELRRLSSAFDSCFIGCIVIILAVSPAKMHRNIVMNAKLVKPFLLRCRSVAVPYTPRLVKVNRVRFGGRACGRGENL